MTRRTRAADGVRYAVYARTAAGGSAGADAQVAALRDAVARRGDGPVVSEHRDVNLSGIGAPGPGLVALLAEVARGSIDVVMVTGIERLGRSERRLREILASIERAGAVVAEVGP